MFCSFKSFAKATDFHQLAGVFHSFSFELEPICNCIIDQGIKPFQIRPVQCAPRILSLLRIHLQGSEARMLADRQKFSLMQNKVI